MFYLSKIFWLLAQPLSLAFLLTAAGLLTALAGARRLGLLFSCLSALVLFLTLYTTAGALLLQALEARVPKPSTDPTSIACMIVLGGAIENDVVASRGGVELNAAADRYTEALRLALSHPQAKILVSGGDGSISGRFPGEAGLAEQFFAALGVPPQRLIKDNTSRNTWENMLNTKALLAANGLTDCLLITSGFHMPRALALFQKAGIAVVPYPVDFRSRGNERLGFDFTQPSLNAQNTATAVREWLGLLGYYLAGRIDWPF
ncbi:YdcF family protein [Rhizobium straminoryzae]|uniref:YdcF family protein n=1 Tax=Rhizobium straminoryzae TaxID=1387186 RepID=A0A549TEE4_9HYPH|nr:YdcF family protein [Rhizobium straminoryzae]TRL40513.1 YdcF family protein [Rhizobium straminoryzae]